jgi:hypothetical protein
MLQKQCNQLANRSFLSSRLDFLTDFKNLATMFRKLLLVSLFVLPTLLVQAQYNIIATETESWINPNFPSSDYNLNSSYLFLLNPSALQAVFEGDGLNKGEKKDVGLKKGDGALFASRSHLPTKIRFWCAIASVDARRTA